MESVSGHDVSQGSGAVFDRPTARISSKREKRYSESRRHDDVDDERHRLCRLEREQEQERKYGSKKRKAWKETERVGKTLINLRTIGLK